MKNRNGSYKKILLSEDELKAQGEILRTGLADLKKACLSPIHFTTLYIILFLRLRHQKNWLQKKTKIVAGNDELLKLIPASFQLNAWEKEKLSGLSVVDFFSACSLKGIPYSVNKAMINWLKGDWKIIMLEHIPSSYELLEMQVQNARCITLITDPEKIDKLVMESRDPLSFVVHDLMHADQFWSHEEALAGQLGFYRRIKDVYKRPLLAGTLKTNKSFRKEFEYVASDMNAYSIHLFKCLKSCIYKTEEPALLFLDILSAWQMSDLEKESSYKLNTQNFTLEDELILKNFFERGVAV